MTIEEHVRQQYGIPDRAVLRSKSSEMGAIQSKQLAGSFRGWGDLSFDVDGQIRRIVKAAGNPVWYVDDSDGQVKMIDHRWITKAGVIRPAQSRQQVTVDGKEVTYRLKSASFTMQFPNSFAIDGDFAVSDMGGGVTVKLFVKGAKFDKWFTGVGHPNVAGSKQIGITPDLQYYTIRVKIGGVAEREDFSRLDVGEATIRRGYLWNNRERIPIKTSIENRLGTKYLVKYLPVSFFEDGVAWTTDATTVYTGSGDGFVKKDNSSNWNTTHDATSGSSNDDTGTLIECTSAKGGTNYDIKRAFMPADISSVTGTIDSADLNLYIFDKVDGDDDAQAYIQIVGPTSQASLTALANGDFDTCGAVNSPNTASATYDISSITTSAYLNVPITDLSIFDTTTDNYAKGGAREGHDIEDSVVGTGFSEVRWYSSEQSGTSNDPYYEITEGAATGMMTLNTGHWGGV